MINGFFLYCFTLLLLLFVTFMDVCVSAYTQAHTHAEIRGQLVGFLPFGFQGPNFYLQA